jgi:protein-disulfide isomerase
MTLTAKHPPIYLLLMALLGGLLLAACGPTSQETAPAADGVPLDSTDFGITSLEGAASLESADAETAANSDTAAASDATAVRPAAPTIAPNEETATTDATGIPVGFTEDGHAYRGQLDAPVVMEEFSDYQCPYCSRFASQTMPTLLENQITNGEVLLVFYDFPLESIHPQAFAAANAARCAGEQSAAAYWEMHDHLFATIDQWAVSQPQEIFTNFAKNMGLDAESFATCVAENRYQEAIRSDINLGLSRGVGSTPSFFLNNQPLIGAHPIETFNEAITLIGGGESIVQEAPAAPTVPDEIPMPEAAVLALDDDSVAYAMGNPDAPIQLVEFTDYQCPFCQRHSTDTLPTILRDMVENGRAYYVFKDFPLEQIHPEARVAHIAARCAGQQEAYLEMHDRLFAGQGEWSGLGNEGANEVFIGYANELELDENSFVACLIDPAVDTAVQNSINEGLAYGVSGTPSFFFNGYLASGAFPYSQFEQIGQWIENGELEAQIEASIRAQYEAAVAQQAQQQQPPTPTEPVDVPTDNSYAIGDENAPITIVEYTDFQCPFCSRHFTETFLQLRENYIETGIVRYVFKDFPLTSIHPQAVIAAEAARCAGAQDEAAYVEMHDLIFTNQQAWSNDGAAAVFSGYAGQLGLDTAVFDACLANHDFEAAVYADLDEGIGFGVTGTPAFFINGYFISGAQPYAMFEEAIASFQEAVE